MGTYDRKAGRLNVGFFRVVAKEGRLKIVIGLKRFDV